MRSCAGCICGGFGQLEILAAMPNCGQQYYLGSSPGTANPSYDRTKRFTTITVAGGWYGAAATRTGEAHYNVYAREWFVSDSGRESWRVAVQAALAAALVPPSELRDRVDGGLGGGRHDAHHRRGCARRW